jgi:hypothetical protein
MNTIEQIPKSGNGFYYLCNIEQFSVFACSKIREFNDTVAEEFQAYAMSEVDDEITFFFSRGVCFGFPAVGSRRACRYDWYWNRGSVRRPW